MTKLWRTLVLLVVGVGAAWAVTRIGSGPPAVYDALDDSTAPTDAEIEAQIRRAEVALGDRADPNQELPVEPLRADIAIALPSDL